MRPSIVIPIYQDPIPGWTDNINGPTGLLIGAGKGVIRTMYCDSGESHNRGLNHVIILHQTISFPFSQTGMAITCQWTLRWMECWLLLGISWTTPTANEGFTTCAVRRRLKCPGTKSSRWAGRLCRQRCRWTEWCGILAEEWPLADCIITFAWCFTTLFLRFWSMPFCFAWATSLCKYLLVVLL